MDLKSPNLNMPYIAPAQAQKHVTHNEALSRLDAIVQLSVLTVSDTPPENPQEGQRVIIGPAPTGEFEVQSLKLAAYQDGAWVFYEAKAGWRAYVEDVSELHIFDGETWKVFTSNDSENEEVLIFGINAPADSFNRLAVKAPATLLDNEGAGHQLKVNKAEHGDTASLLFQTGYQGHAEMGLTGGQDFHIKTSADGSRFKDSLIANAQSGVVDFPQGINAAQTVGAMAISGGPNSYYGFANNTAVVNARASYSFLQNRVFFQAVYVDRHSLFEGGFVAQYTASSTAGAIMRVGLYELGDPNGDGWAIGNRIVDLGVQPADEAGQKHYTPTVPIALEAGWYAVAIGVNGRDVRARAQRTHQPELQKFVPFGEGTSADIHVSGPSHYLYNANADEVLNGFSQTYPSNTLTPVITRLTYGLIVFIPKWAA